MVYETARVVKKATSEEVVSIFYCKNAYRHYGYHFCLQRINEDIVGIVFDDLYLGLTNTNPRAFEAMVMHEVGHLVNGDMERQLSTSEIKRERELDILRGKIPANERAADCFAVEHCGKSAVIQMLDIMNAVRKKRNTVDLALALTELELRKQAVKKM